MNSVERFAKIAFEAYNPLYVWEGVDKNSKKWWMKVGEAIIKEMQHETK